MSEAKVSLFVDAIAEQRVELVRTECQSHDDLLALAAAYLTEAHLIFRQVGGEKMVALMMYSAGDEAAAKSDA